MAVRWQRACADTEDSLVPHNLSVRPHTEDNTNPPCFHPD